MADVTERIEKQIEGTNLALAAVAEVLQKMDSRLSKEEESLAQDAYASQQANAKADLVKSIAKEVLAVMKDTEGKGMPVSGSERKAKTTGGTPQNADDSESGAAIGSKTEDAQNTIQAMRKRYGEDENGEEEEEEDFPDKAYKGGMARKNEEEDEADDEAADFPVDEKDENGEEEDDEDGPQLKAMRKQIAAMKKQLEATEAGMQKAIQTEAENRLRKMGFREEIGLKAPQLTNGLGVDGSTPLVKAAQGDTVEQLASLSYSELRKLQTQIEMGQTDGVPKELMG